MLVVVSMRYDCGTIDHKYPHWDRCLTLHFTPSPGCPPMRVPKRGYPFSLPLFKGAVEVALHCAHRATTVLSWGLCEQEGHPAAPFPPPILLVISQGWELIDLPLRALKYSLTQFFSDFSEVAGCGLHCAHRATTVLSWGPCEHRDHTSYFASHLQFCPPTRTLIPLRSAWPEQSCPIVHQLINNVFIRSVALCHLQFS